MRTLQRTRKSAFGAIAIACGTVGANADSASRLTERDSNFHIVALQLTEPEVASAQTIFECYVEGTANAERAVADFVAWRGRWMKEHIYWLQFREWADRITPLAWAIQPALDGAYDTLRDQYFEAMECEFPEKASRIALLAKAASRAEWLHSGLLLHEYPELTRVLAEVAPHTLDDPLVTDATLQYETRLEPVIARRKRLQETFQSSVVRAVEARDQEKLAQLSAAIPLNDRDIWLTTLAMIDVFASALPAAEGNAFRGAVDAALYPEPPLSSPVDGLVERAERDPTLSAAAKARAQEIGAEIAAERERLRPALQAAFAAVFDKSNIETFASEQAASMLGLNSGAAPSFDGSYQEIVKSYWDRSDRLAVELQEMIQGD